MSADATSPANETATPVACTLTPQRIPRQLGEWGELVARADRVDIIAGGVRFDVPVTLEAEANDLIARERSCCSFLDISTAVDGTRLAIEVTSTHPDALPIISLIVGRPLS